MTETVGNSRSGKKSRPSRVNEMAPRTTRMAAIMDAVTFFLTENSGSFIS